MNEDNLQKYVVVSIVTALLIISVLSGWAIMNYLKQDDPADTFTIEGTYLSDDQYECTGTASYIDLQESSREYVYQFTFMISYTDDGGTIHQKTMLSILDIVKDTKKPNETLFEYIGTSVIDDTIVSIWIEKDTSEGIYTYYLSGMNIVKIDIDSDEFTLQVTNDNH